MVTDISAHGLENCAVIERRLKLKDRALFILDYEEFLLFGDVRRASGKKKSPDKINPEANELNFLSIVAEISAQ